MFQLRVTVAAAIALNLSRVSCYRLLGGRKIGGDDHVGSGKRSDCGCRDNLRPMRSALSIIGNASATPAIEHALSRHQSA